MGILQRFQAAFTAFSGSAPGPEDDFWYRPIPRGTIPGTNITPAASLAVAAVYACVRVIAETCASLPFNVYRRLPDGRGKEVADNHSLHNIIRYQPNEEQTAFEFWELVLVHALTAGNAFAEVTYGPEPKRTVQELCILQPSLVEIGRETESGEKFYRVKETPSSEAEIFFGDEILHIPGLGYDGLRGYSPIEMLRRAVEIAQASEIYQAQFFANGATPNTYITIPGALTKDNREALREWLKANYGGLGNAHKPGIFEGGGKMDAVPINHRDLQFLELRKFQTEEIARIFRVPLHLIQNLDRATFANIEHQSVEFANFTLRPWLTRIEQRVNMTLLGVREAANYFCEFNMSALLRGDSAARAEYYSKAISSAIMTPNEARAMENMNWLPGGDQLLVQGAMIPLEKAGETPAAPPAP